MFYQQKLIIKLKIEQKILVSGATVHEYKTHVHVIYLLRFSKTLQYLQYFSESLNIGLESLISLLYITSQALQASSYLRT